MGLTAAQLGPWLRPAAYHPSQTDKTDQVKPPDSGHPRLTQTRKTNSDTTPPPGEVKNRGRGARTGVPCGAKRLQSLVTLASATFSFATYTTSTDEAVAKATRYPEGGTSTNTGPGHHKGPTTGERGNKRQGREPTTAKKRTNAKEPHHTKRGTQGPKEKTPAETQAKAQTQQKTPQRGARHEERDTKPRTNRRQGKHDPNHEHANKRPNHKRGARRELDPKKRKKTPTTQ